MKLITQFFLLVLIALLMSSCDKNSASSENISTSEITTASTTTSIKQNTTITSSITTSSITTSTQESVTTIQDEADTDNCFVSSDNAKLLCFSGLFDYDGEMVKRQTLDTDIINNFIYELNNIEYSSSEKATMSGGENWAEGFWDVNIYKDGKVLYNVHAERNVLYIIDLTMPNAENNCTIITINDDIRHDFQEKAFDFSHKSWDDYVNYLNEFQTEISEIDTYGGAANSDSSGCVVLVASEDFSAYKEVESKYSEFHSFPEIKYQTAEYSLKELNQACEIINQHASEYSVYYVTAVSKCNQIEIYLLQDTEENRAALTELSPVKNIEFVLADEYLPNDNPAT